MDPASLLRIARLAVAAVGRCVFKSHHVVVLGMVASATDRPDAKPLADVEHGDRPAIEWSGPIAQLRLFFRDAGLRRAGLPQFDVEVVADFRLSGDATKLVNLVIANDTNPPGERP